jgi:hypothetical protein
MVMQGANDLKTDWTMHRAKAVEYASMKRCRVLRVQDHATVLRLMRYYMKHLVAEDYARALYIFLGIVVAIVAVSLFILEALLRNM